MDELGLSLRFTDFKQVMFGYAFDPNRIRQIFPDLTGEQALRVRAKKEEYLRYEEFPKSIIMPEIIAGAIKSGVDIEIFSSSNAKSLDWKLKDYPELKPYPKYGGLEKREKEFWNIAMFRIQDRVIVFDDDPLVIEIVQKHVNAVGVLWKEFEV